MKISALLAAALTCLSVSTMAIESGAQTIELIDQLATGAQPRLAIDSGRHRLYVAESSDRTLRVYDTRTRQLLHDLLLVAVPGSSNEPGAMAVEVDSRANLVYITFWGTEHRIWIIDGETLQATILPRFDDSYDSLYPLYIAVDEERTRAYVCHETPNGTVTVVDGRTKTQLTQIKNNDNVCRGIAADPTTGRVFLTTASHNLYRIDPATFVATNIGAWGRGPLQVDDQTRRLFVSSDHYVHLALLDVDTERHIMNVPVPGTTDVAVVPGGSRVYVTNIYGNFVAAVEPGYGERARFNARDAESAPFCCNGEVIFDPSTRLIVAAEYFGRGIHLLRDNGLQHSPTANPATVVTDEDTPLNTALTATDPDGDTLTYRIVSGPSHGTLSLSGVSATYTPVANYFGADSFTFVASDGTSDSEPAEVKISVRPVNDAPTVLVPASYSVSLGGSTLLGGIGTDVEDAALLWQWDLDGDGVFETLQESPAFAASRPGSTTVSVRVVDSGGLIATASTTVQVTYGVCLLYNPEHAVRAGATIPLKLQLCDASGRNVSRPDVAVTAGGVLRVSDQANGVVEDAGHANPDANFRFDANLNGYIFNFKTTGLGTGTWAVHFVTSTSTHRYSVPFQVR